jgi:hypothetical protein
MQPDVYGINLLTGAALLNGVSPSRLPAGVLNHPDYAPLFGGLELDVTGDLRTRHAICDRFYRFQIVPPGRLVVFEMRTATEEGEVLELLPGVPFHHDTVTTLNFKHYSQIFCLNGPIKLELTQPEKMSSVRIFRGDRVP